MNKPRILVAMSGGVDSSVTAALLIKNGYDVIGVTMLFWEEQNSSSSLSPARKHIEDAKNVADTLKIPHVTIDAKERFENYVINDFINEYTLGHTPNPCVNCNFWLKFNILLKEAQKHNCEYIATGHYAKTEYSNGYFRLLKAKNPNKDQSYVLYRLKQDVLSKVIFPLADFDSKEEIKTLAQTLNLSVSNKPDSQDICFITDNDTKGFLLKQKPTLKNPGNIIFAQTKKIIGKHEGIAFYTVGQRKGLGIAWSEPLYVTKIDAQKNEIIVDTNEHVFKKELLAKNISFTGPVLESGETAKTMAKIRYAHKETPATITMLDKTSALVNFEIAQRAITPGQSVVFYDKNAVIGGGIIAKDNK